MPASLAASALYGPLFNDPETAALFTDSAEVRAMMLVEGTLAKVQGALGLIPADAAAYLHRASFELQIDPAGLAAETATNGVPVPALIAAFAKAAQAPEHDPMAALGGHQSGHHGHRACPAAEAPDRPVGRPADRPDQGAWANWPAPMPTCRWPPAPMASPPPPPALARWLQAGAIRFCATTHGCKP